MTSLLLPATFQTYFGLGSRKLQKQVNASTQADSQTRRTDILHKGCKIALSMKLQIRIIVLRRQNMVSNVVDVRPLMLQRLNFAENASHKGTLANQTLLPLEA